MCMLCPPLLFLEDYETFMTWNPLKIFPYPFLLFCLLEITLLDTSMVFISCVSSLGDKYHHRRQNWEIDFPSMKRARMRDRETSLSIDSSYPSGHPIDSLLFSSPHSWTFTLSFSWCRESLDVIHSSVSCGNPCLHESLVILLCQSLSVLRVRVRPSLVSFSKARCCSVSRNCLSFIFMRGSLALMLGCQSIASSCTISLPANNFNAETFPHLFLVSASLAMMLRQNDDPHCNQRQQFIRNHLNPLHHRCHQLQFRSLNELHRWICYVSRLFLFIPATSSFFRCHNFGPFD